MAHNSGVAIHIVFDTEFATMPYSLAGWYDESTEPYNEDIKRNKAVMDGGRSYMSLRPCQNRIYWLCTVNLYTCSPCPGEVGYLKAS